MLNLTFVQDEALRQSLENDFLEIENAYDNGSWKSVHVLAGSIIEALLIETIISIDPSVNKAKLLKMHLDELIPKAKALGILGSVEENMSSVLQEYRNLIHPGRVLRLKQSINKDTASITLSLVRIISSKLEVEQGKKIGHTASTIINKMQRDSGFPSIIHSLLEKTSPKEKLKLVLELLPPAISELVIQEDQKSAEEFTNVYHVIVNGLDNSQIKELEERIIWEIENRDESGLEIYFTHLLSIDVIARFSDESKNLIMKYSLDRLKRHFQFNPQIFQGISELPENILDEFVHTLFYKVINSTNPAMYEKCIEFLRDESIMFDNGLKLYNSFEKAAGRWKSALDSGIRAGKDWEEHRTRFESFERHAPVLPF